jgi:hypothetical protein
MLRKIKRGIKIVIALSRRRKALVPTAVLVLAASAPSCALARSKPMVSVSTVDVSAAVSPAPACASTGSEGEVALTSDPQRRRHILMAYLQDHNAAVIMASSRDTGGHWSLAAVPRLTTCTGGSSPRVVDPFVTVGADGRGYLGSIDIPSGSGTLSAAADSWERWDAPITVDPSAGDWESVLADPHVSGLVRMSWTSYLVDPVLGLPVQSRIRFAQSSDGGRTLGPPAVVHQDAPNKADVQTTLVQLPHALVDVFGESAVVGSADQQVYASRSTDGGRTWDAAVEAGIVPNFRVVDPDSGATMRSYCCPFAVASDASGAIDLAYIAGAGAHAARVMLRRSSDGGATWAPDQTLAQVAGQAFSPALAVARDGRIGVLWQDTAPDKPGDSVLGTETMFASSTDYGAAWVEQRLGGIFNLRSDNIAQGTSPLGDYTALTATGDGFVAGFPQAQPVSRRGPSDVFAVHLVPCHPGTPRRHPTKRRGLARRRDGRPCRANISS